MRFDFSALVFFWHSTSLTPWAQDTGTFCAMLLPHIRLAMTNANIDGKEILEPGRKQSNKQISGICVIQNLISFCSREISEIRSMLIRVFLLGMLFPTIIRCPLAFLRDVRTNHVLWRLLVNFRSVARECWVHQLALLHVLSTRRQLKQRLAAVNLRITAAKFDNSIKF